MEDVVGRGTVLAGRYRVLQLVGSDLPGASSWQATDQILDRPVRVRVLEQGNVAQALDAARRAALVSDPRLVRVLDVGTHQGSISYVVTEQVTGPSLSDLLARGPLSADQARAVVGEAAAALEVARRRGVHHLALRPTVLHVTPEDRVLLTGLALDGALLGQGLGDARSTTRADTVGLVRLLYAALTGRWPTLDGEIVPSDTLPAAPVRDGLLVPPADLVRGIPADLDTLCAVTLGPHEDGPHSPAELVRELEPWGEIRTIGLGEVLAAAATAPLEEQLTPAAPPETRPVQVQRQSVRSAFDEQAPAGTGRPGTPPPAHPRGGPAFAQSAPAATRPMLPTPPPPPPAPAVAETVVAAGPPTTVGPPPVQRQPAAPARQQAAPTQRTPARPQAGPYDQAAPSFAVGFGAHDDEPDVFDISGDDDGEVAERRFDPTKIVLLVVAIVVVIGVVIAFNALRSPVGGTEAATSPSASETAAAPPAEGDQPAEEEPADEAPADPAPPAGAAPTIAGATSVDPSDSDGEHEEAVSLAFDGDPASFWYTQTYNRPEFGGLKPGVGYVITLAGPSTVSGVTLKTNQSGGNVEVRATDAANPGGGTVLASGPVAPDTVFTFPEPVETGSIVLWFTSLPQAVDGKYRVEVTELALS
ncbi:protein kinase family protein [Cellulomonas cellasea]|uniref:Protein kinase domain-containing protein n=3 Tax=Cellulomonas cellasea TaxID=43670 RepID=A0A4Y3KVN0_9CELL|nr:protein kinase family protein [Cellulomonas cellasea]GEA87305.1 hypothetical protein CCE01nite_12540 [Cellulomonas cellasea]